MMLGKSSISTLLLLSSATTSAFVPQSCRTSSSPSTSLKGFGEWREMSDVVSTENHPDYHLHDGSSTTLRPISILPKTYADGNVPLPGQTTYLQFVDETELNLFDMALERHEGIFALGLVSTDDEEDVDRTMLATMPLVEIQEFNNMGRRLGIFCVARVVGKAKIHQVFWPHSSESSSRISHSQPFQALVYDADDEFSNAEIAAANQVADGIELLVSYLTRMEISLNNDDDGDDNDDDLVTTRDVFMEAYEASLRSDPQEYNIPFHDVQPLGQRSWRELKAISWAAFACSKQHPHHTDRQDLQALYTTSVLGRLQLARNWLSGIRVKAPSSKSEEERVRR